MKIFVNFTNHSSALWSEKQRAAALEYADKIVDMLFPEVDPTGDEDYIEDLAEDYMVQIWLMYPAAVLCQGEFTLAYRVIMKLKERGIPVLAACSRRVVEERGDKKIVAFEFERFREY